jgi:hypothetical protein
MLKNWKIAEGSPGSRHSSQNTDIRTGDREEEEGMGQGEKRRGMEALVEWVDL